MVIPASAHAAQPVRLHAAGSLRAALTEIARAFGLNGGGPVEAKFGASGLLRDEIAGGVRVEIFASANMEHPQSLSRTGQSGPVVLFARNRLCALARPGFNVTTATLVERMLEPGVKLGTSTPKADPSGDYAWEAFRRIDAQRPGSLAILDKKALQLTGGPTSPRPPANRSVYALIVERGDADIFLTYCTNARVAAAEAQGAKVVELPEAIAVGADYGLTVMNGASELAYRLAMFLLSTEGQAIFARHGFTAPNTPAQGDAMRISARNQLKGKVIEVIKGATTTHVKIDVNGQTVTASITNEAAEELGLATGKPVTAIVKASDVMVGVDN